MSQYCLHCSYSTTMIAVWAGDWEPQGVLALRCPVVIVTWVGHVAKSLYCLCCGHRMYHQNLKARRSALRYGIGIVCIRVVANYRRVRCIRHANSHRRSYLRFFALSVALSSSSSWVLVLQPRCSYFQVRSSFHPLCSPILSHLRRWFSSVVHPFPPLPIACSHCLFIHHCSLLLRE